VAVDFFVGFPEFMLRNSRSPLLFSFPHRISHQSLSPRC